MNLLKILKNEEEKQKNTISLIASENVTSDNVRNALSSVFTNKYAEGYPGKRYYSGCEFADLIENYAIDLTKKIFNAKWANVQPHSGSQANQAVYFGLLNIGDTILSLSLEAGGHLTHGALVSSVSSLYKIVHYTIDENGLIDMNEVEKLAKEHKPKLIITGASAYPRKWDWAKFREIANLNNSYLMADIAHIAGIIAAGYDESPIEHAHIITSTTHKTLRGARGGIIFSNNENNDIEKKINRALFPGIQGGPLMNNIAAKAFGFEENLKDDYKIYIKNVLKNAQILSNAIMKAGGKLVSNGTDNHLMILNCQSFGMTGKETEKLLEEAGVFASASALKGESWMNPNGMRLGTPYITNIFEDITEFSELFVKCLVSKNNSLLKEFLKNNLNKL